METGKADGEVKKLPKRKARPRRTARRPAAKKKAEKKDAKPQAVAGDKEGEGPVMEAMDEFSSGYPEPPEAEGPTYSPSVVQERELRRHVIPPDLPSEQEAQTPVNSVWSPPALDCPIRGETLPPQPKPQATPPSPPGFDGKALLTMAQDALAAVNAQISALTTVVRQQDEKIRALESSVGGINGMFENPEFYRQVGSTILAEITQGQPGLTAALGSPVPNNGNGEQPMAAPQAGPTAEQIAQLQQLQQMQALQQAQQAQQSQSGGQNNNTMDILKAIMQMASYANASPAAPQGPESSLIEGVKLMGQMFSIFTDFQKNALSGIKETMKFLKDEPEKEPPRHRHT